MYLFRLILFVVQHKDIVTAVSFEKYTLGPDSTLVESNVTEVGMCHVVLYLCSTHHIQTNKIN
jgi:hypothetical protein